MGWNEMVEIFSLVVFFGHAVFSSLLLGWMPILFLADWLGGDKRKKHFRSLVQKMRTGGERVLVLTVMLGLLALFLHWSENPNDFRRMMEAVGTGWGAMLMFLLIVSWGLHREKSNLTGFNQHPFARLGMMGVTFGGIVGMTFVFVVTQTLIINPGYAENIMDSGVMSSVNLPTVWPRFFHMVLGGLAGTGVVVAIFGTWSRSTDDENEERALNADVPYDINITRYGIAWTLAGTLPQIAVGPWLLFTLPQGVRDGLVDGGSVGSLVFFLSLTSALLALVLLNAALMVPQTRGLVWSGVGSLVLTAVLMVIVRGEVRKSWSHVHLESKTVEELSGWVVLSVIVIIFGGLGVLGRYLLSGRGQNKAFQLG